MPTDKVNVDNTFDRNSCARSLQEEDWSLQVKDDRQQKKKSFILERISNAIINIMENSFYWVGNLIGSHPWKSAMLSLFVVGIFSAGTAKFENNSDIDTLWTLPDSLVYKYKNWVDANFKTTTHFVSVIFVDSNVLTPSVLQAMYKFYHKTQSLKTSKGKNFTDLCDMSGTNCFVTSILELWSYQKTDINAASLNDIKTKIKTTRTSPIFYTDFHAATVLGGISYSSGDVNTAKAAQITWLLNADSINEDDAMQWEKLAIDLALKGQSGIANVYVMATRSFDDVGFESTKEDATLLSAGYSIVIVFVILMIGNFNLLDFGLGMALCGLMVIGVSIGFSFGLASAAGWLYTPLHSALPFLLLGVGVDDLFVVIAAYRNLPTKFQNAPLNERIAMTLKYAGVSITVTSLTDMFAFGIGATTVLPALRSFCVFCCLGILALYLLAVTFFVACLALNAKRTDANKNSLVCCYTHKPEYRRNECSKKKFLTIFFKKYFGPFLVKPPVKITSMCVTAILLGIGTWGFLALEQEFDPFRLLPTNSYPSKFDKINNKYFTSEGPPGAVYCKNLDYYNSKAKFETLYTKMTNAKFVESGSVDSWFNSFTSYLSSASAASVTSKIDSTTKYPTTDPSFYDLLYGYITTQAAGKRFASQLKFSGTSPNLDLTASYITFKHTIFKTSSEKINGMEDMMKLVADIFPNDDCFPYSRDYLFWYTNKVIQAELYRNLSIAALCVFLVCLVLVANIITSLMVFLCVVLTLLDVGGMMHFWNMTIDTVTSLILILAVGLVVDYSAHIGYCFMTVTGNKNDRVKATLVKMGAPVFNGGFSTFLAFVLLPGSSSYVSKSFFKVFLFVVVFGLFHGLVFLPTLLSWLGPAPYDTSHRKNYQQKDLDLNIISTDNTHQGVRNSAMSNKEDKVWTSTPPPKYEKATSDQPYIPRPDYTPPNQRKLINSRRTTPEDKVWTSTPPPKYEKATSVQPYIPPPDYTPPTRRKSTSGRKILSVDI